MKSPSLTRFSLLSIIAVIICQKRKIFFFSLKLFELLGNLTKATAQPHFNFFPPSLVYEKKNRVFLLLRCAFGLSSNAKQVELSFESSSQVQVYRCWAFYILQIIRSRKIPILISFQVQKKKRIENENIYKKKFLN